MGLKNVKTAKRTKNAFYYYSTQVLLQATMDIKTVTNIEQIQSPNVTVTDQFIPLHRLNSTTYM